MKVNVGDRLPVLEVKIRARHVVMGASSSRDWQPQHHDTHWAVERVKVKDIFMNTPNQAGWIERYLTDWTGPKGRLGKVRFTMKKSVCAGDTLRFDGTVTAVAEGWVDVEVKLSVEDETATECTARIAVPTSDDDDPWARRGDDWRP
jgi:acyl dehydratase